MHLPSLLRSLGRMGLRALAVASPLILSGCSWIQGHQSTFQTEGPVAKEQLDVFYVTCWVTGVIFVLVGGVLAYAQWKFTARTAADEHAEPPEQSHGNPMIEVSLIGLSVLALVIIAIPTLRAVWFSYEIPEDRKQNAYEVSATGYQWWFKFEYPNEQIEGAGPLTVGNELVIPAGRPVRVNLRTVDVIHSWWVPKLAGKVDMIPNRANHLWLQADKPGYFWGQCAEYCGDSHAVMRFRVIALGEAEFADWLNKQKAVARTVTAASVAAADQPRAQFAALKQFKRNEAGYSDKYDVSPLDNWVQMQHEPKAGDEDSALIARGRKLFQEKTCIACHTVRGHEGIGVTGPNLTHVGSRTTIAAGLLETNPEQMIRWLMYPNEVKPGNRMYYGGYKTLDNQTGQWKDNFTINEEEARALAAYLLSLK